MSVIVWVLCVLGGLSLLSSGVVLGLLLWGSLPKRHCHTFRVMHAYWDQPEGPAKGQVKLACACGHVTLKPATRWDSGLVSWIQ